MLLAVGPTIELCNAAAGGVSATEIGVKTLGWRLAELNERLLAFENRADNHNFNSTFDTESVNRSTKNSDVFNWNMSFSVPVNFY